MPFTDLVETILASITRPEDGPDAADRLEPLTVATRWIPANRGGKSAHVAKAHRGREKGMPTPDGGRVCWRQVRGPSGWYTTRRWTAEWLAAITAAYEGQAVEPPAPPCTSAARRQAIARAEAELSADGF